MTAAGQPPPHGQRRAAVHLGTGTVADAGVGAGTDAGGDTEPVPLEAFLGSLAALPAMGNLALRSILALGTPQEVWDLVRSGRIPPSASARFSPKVAEAARGWHRDASQIDPSSQWQRWQQQGIGVVSIGSPSYPQCLIGDADPPVVLFHRGDIDVLAAPRVAVVGTRKATGYGRRIAHELGAELASAGVCVVSGLALGIDASAHHGVVAAFDRSTVNAGGVEPAGPVAVVGGGVDAPGPATNATLARRVVQHGVVLSEAPPRTRPAAWRFPVRNRILAALAQVVVVVESADRGGSMLTVEQAQQRDRAVLAVPGPIDSAASAGTNSLLADGAGVCRGIDDVLVTLGISHSVDGSRTPVPDARREPDGDAASVLHLLGFSPTSVESLSRELDFDVTRLSVALGELESLGWAQRRGPFVERVARAT